MKFKPKDKSIAVTGENLKTTLDVKKYAILEMNSEQYYNMAQLMLRHDEVLVEFPEDRTFVIVRKK